NKRSGAKDISYLRGQASVCSKKKPKFHTSKKLIQNRKITRLLFMRWLPILIKTVRSKVSTEHSSTGGSHDIGGVISFSRTADGYQERAYSQLRHYHKTACGRHFQL